MRPSHTGGLVTLGETMALLTTPAATALPHAGELELSVAGAESNVAIGIRRLGLPASFITRVGDDGFGRRVIRDLLAENLDLRVARDPHRPTGLMVKERRRSDATHVLYYRSGSAASALGADDVDAELVRSAGVLHLSGITPALGAGPADAAWRAAELAREAGVTVSVDVNFRSRLWAAEQARPVLRSLVAVADVVFAGADEAAVVTGAGHSEATQHAEALLALGPTTAVIKLGADGALAATAAGMSTTPAVAVDVVDTVGAGDAFVAGYLSEHLQRAGLQQRLDTGARAGAFACTSASDWHGLPYAEEINTTYSDEVIR
ncbi:MAG TPA: sugar kinase [Jiangellaceae bacterium]|nr:sugar kinase [Jiangellaceae bacterium]